MQLLLAAARTTEAIVRDTDRDCCVYARDVLALHVGQPLDADRELWCLWREADGSLPASRAWGPVVAAQRAGLLEASAIPPAGHVLRQYRWHVCQGWISDPVADPRASGHTWLWRALDATHGVCVESSRDIGPRVSLLRWSDRVRRYRHGVAVGVLRREP